MADLKQIELSGELYLDVILEQLDENQQSLVISFRTLDDELLQRSQPKTWTRKACNTYVSVMFTFSLPSNYG